MRSLHETLVDTVLTEKQIDKILYQLVSTLQSTYHSVDATYGPISCKDIILNDRLDMVYLQPPDRAQDIFSPEELWFGQAYKGTVSDTWYVGLVLYQMLSGQELFPSSLTMSEKNMKVLLFDAATALDIAYPKFEALLKDCLEKNYRVRKGTRALVDKYFLHYV